MTKALLSNGYLWMTLTLALKFYPASRSHAPFCANESARWLPVIAHCSMRN